MLQVVSGLWLDESGHLFVGKRKGPSYAGCWETPGGKVDPGETLRQALARELSEELGVNAEVGPNPEFWVDLEDCNGIPYRVNFFLVSISEEPELTVHTEFRFADPNDPHPVPHPWVPSLGEVFLGVQELLHKRNSSGK